MCIWVPGSQHEECTTSQFFSPSFSSCVLLTGDFVRAHARLERRLSHCAGRLTRFSLASAISSPFTSFYLLQELTIPFYKHDKTSLFLLAPALSNFCPEYGATPPLKHSNSISTSLLHRSVRRLSALLHPPCQCLSIFFPRKNYRCRPLLFVIGAIVIWVKTKRRSSRVPVASYRFRACSTLF